MVPTAAMIKAIKNHIKKYRDHILKFNNLQYKFKKELAEMESWIDYKFIQEFKINDNSMNIKQKIAWFESRYWK